MQRRLVGLGFLFASIAAAVVGCGSDSSSDGRTDGMAFGGGGGMGAGTGGVINTGGEGGGGLPSGCASDVYGGELLPVDLYFVVDRSGSMQGAVWDAVKDAITTFVQAPESAGVGVGLQFFPADQGLPNCGLPPNCLPGCVEFPPPIPMGPPPLLCIPLTGGSCDINDYLPPAVMIAPLPGAAQSIVGALNMTQPSGGTPTLPAMQSAVQATTALAMSNPGRQVVIVLATDGDPNDCMSTIQNVAQEAQMAANGNPSVKTFVIGIGNIQGLDQIAMAGGTGTALQVDAANAGQEFLDALSVIRGSISCNLAVPIPPEGQELMRGSVNLGFTPSGGSGQEIIPGVADASQCQGQAGWHYDPNNPDFINLCPASCDQVTNVQGTLEVVTGCTTVVR